MQGRTVVALLALSVAALAPAAEPSSTRFLPLASQGTDQVPHGVGQSLALSRLAGTRLEVALGLPLRNQDDLALLLRDLHDPASPMYRQWLTPEAFTARFGPTAVSYGRVRAWAEARGLQVVQTAPNRLILNLSGEAADIERAFGVELRTYLHPSGRVFRSPDRAPTMDLDEPVATINGLNDFILPVSRLVKGGKVLDELPPSGSGPGGTYLGRDFRAGYGAGIAASVTGRGQGIALLEFSSYYPVDPKNYWMDAMMKGPAITDLAVAGGTKSYAGNDEVSLDIEIAGAMAPGAHLYVYMGTDGNTLLNRIATDNTCKQVGISWSWTTDAMTRQTSKDPSQEAILQQLDSQGIACFVAAGDSGTWTAGQWAEKLSDPAFDPINPADSPSITCVGGTNLWTTAGGCWSSERAWSLGGGGYSHRYAMPGYQAGIGWSAVGGASAKMRNAPDVAAIASNVYVDSGDGQLAQNFGGTSCAAPLWAACSALVNQCAVTNGQATLGCLNPVLYGIENGSGAAMLHDLSPGGLGPAYDLETGWGSPMGQVTIDALLNY